MVILLMSFATANQQQHVLTPHAMLFQVAQLLVQEIGVVVYAQAALLGTNILVSRLSAVSEPVQMKIQTI